MNHDSRHPTHDTSGTGRASPTLDPGGGYITTINIYTVTPERIEEVLEYLVRSATENLRQVPGFVSFNFHVSLDGTQVVNYGQWESLDALAAAQNDPRIVALRGETAKIVSSSKPIPCLLRASVAAADKNHS